MSWPWTLPSAVLTISVSAGARIQQVKVITPKVVSRETLPINLIFTVSSPPDSNLSGRRRSVCAENSAHGYPESSASVRTHASERRLRLSSTPSVHYLARFFAVRPFFLAAILCGRCFAYRLNDQLIGSVGL